MNDQSPDRSQDIIDAIAQDDPRIRSLVQPENHGQGYARNTALDVAKGDFAFFLDADDLLADATVLEEAWNAAMEAGADLVRLRKLAFLHGSDPLEAHPDPVEKFFSKDTLVDDPINSTWLLKSWHVWNWLYSRSLIEQHGIRFATGQWEERYFFCKALKHSQRARLLARDGVRYRQRAISTTSRARVRNDLIVLAEGIEAVAREFPTGEVSTILATQFASFFVGQGAWAAGLGTAVREDEERCLEALASAFDMFDVSFAGIQKQANDVLELEDRIAPVGLMLAAIRAKRWDLAAVAISTGQIDQSAIYDAYFSNRPSGGDDLLEATLNNYARNNSVRVTRVQTGRQTRPIRLILHIGASKTGSTALQNHLELNRPELMRSGIWYPEAGLFWQTSRPGKQAGHALFIEAATSGAPELREYLRSGLELMPDRIHTIVLSSEAFFLNEASHKIAEYLKEFEVEVVLYLRRQDTWANSQYCEFVGGGAVGRVSATIEDWLEQADTRRLMDYRTVISRFQKTVPNDRITVRIYDRQSLRGGDLIGDFASVVGLSEIGELARPGKEFSNDVRLSGAQIERMRQYNQKPFATRSAYFRFVEDVSRRLDEWRRKAGLQSPRPMFLNPDTRVQITKQYRQANLEIKETWFDDTVGPLFADDDNADPGPVPPLTDAEEEIFRDVYDLRSQEASIASEPRMINYGLWGWRLWALTPLVRTQIRKQGNAEDFELFDRDPATYMHSLQSPRYQAVARRLYPQGSLMGPYDVLRIWVPILAPFASLIAGRGAGDRLRANPTLFFREHNNRLVRIFGRIFFPVGELIGSPKQDRSEDPN